MTTKTPRAGDRIHLLASMTIAVSESHSEVVRRGQTITITDEILRMSRDRNGVSWLDLVDDADAQTERYGARLFARGECPPEVTWWNGEGDSASRSLARQLATEQANQISDPADRRAALAEASATYGERVTSTSLGYVTR